MLVTHRNIQKILAISLALSLSGGLTTNKVFAEDSPSVLYVPLIGITSVPTPLALPKGAGNVTYSYAVKNFLKESPLTDVQVTDNTCDSIRFLTGDDNHDSKLDYSETWRYSCTTRLTETTQSVATATGHANNLTAIHNAYATVVLGVKDPAPLVSIINITKVAHPLSLPAEGGKISFTYKVNNPGVVPLSDVAVTDNKCKGMSGKLGDTNGNNLLDTNEVWIYHCSTTLKDTTTNTVTVSASANGLKASDNATLTVVVETPVTALPQVNPSFPNAGIVPNLKLILWGILAGILICLFLFFVLTHRDTIGKHS